GKVKNLRVSNSTVQKHVTPFEFGLLIDWNGLVAAVLNHEVLILPAARVVPIHGDGSLDAAVREPAVLKSDAIRFPKAGVLPEGEKVLRLVFRVCSEVEMPSQAGPADLG